MHNKQCTLNLCTLSSAYKIVHAKKGYRTKGPKYKRTNGQKDKGTKRQMDKITTGPKGLREKKTN